MKTLVARRVAIGLLATALVLGSGLLVARSLGSPRLFVAPTLCIIFLCVLGEWGWPPTARSATHVGLAAGAGRAAALGFAVWIITAELAYALGEPGDKWDAYIVIISPAAAIVGGVVGALLRFSRYRAHGKTT